MNPEIKINKNQKTKQIIFIMQKILMAQKQEDDEVLNEINSGIFPVDKSNKYN